ncbi:MAG: hypothetical protein J07AB43_09680 [Candidatus Nanosalina sp. J07AB43]|nr:MAG: hypothetical protein J07AB43_09680 [Candidatus Nanosalina sp. J07AB43]
MFKIDEMLEPDEQADFIASAGVLLEKDDYEAKHYNSLNDFRKNTKFNTRSLISFGKDTKEIEKFVIEDRLNYGGDKHGFSGEVYAYAVDHPKKIIDYDVRRAKWDNPRSAPNRIHVPHAVRSVAESYFESAKRKI